MSELYVEPTIAAWCWGWRLVLDWRAVLARPEVVEVVGVLVDV